jgi:hypothetical protein
MILFSVPLTGWFGPFSLFLSRIPRTLTLVPKMWNFLKCEASENREKEKKRMTTVQRMVQFDKDPLLALSEHALRDPEGFIIRYKLKSRIPSHRLPVIVCMDEKGRIALFDTWTMANRLRTPTFAFSLEPSYKIRGFTNRPIVQEVSLRSSTTKIPSIKVGNHG